jgi:hypothetical protein
VPGAEWIYSIKPIPPKSICDRFCDWVEAWFLGIARPAPIHIPKNLWLECGVCGRSEIRERAWRNPDEWRGISQIACDCGNDGRIEIRRHDRFKVRRAISEARG